MIRYCLTIFLSAFLLFQIQPVIARMILPTFGWTAAVWTTCMMFFQVALFLGYLYAHLLRVYFKPPVAWTIHMSLVLVSAMLCHLREPSIVSIQEFSDSLPAFPASMELTLSILIVLTTTVGLPFFVLSTTGPLVQAWQATSHPNHSPFRLYALSNLASVLGLVTYPFLVELFLPVDSQIRYWTISFLVFGLVIFYSGLQTKTLPEWSGGDTMEEAVGPISKRRQLAWLLLPATSSVILLATTNLLCQEVASIPFLWVIPLTLYLLSFIICFDKPILYRRRLWMGLLSISVFASVLLFHLGVNAGLTLQVIGLASVVFFGSMVCHGELEKSKPDESKLTLFYLYIAIGGALGGIFVSVIAPKVFNGFYEFHLGLTVSLLVSLYAVWRCLYRSNPEQRQTGMNRMATFGVGLFSFVSLCLVLVSLLYLVDPNYHQGLVFRGRNDYGLTTVIDVDDKRRDFINGRVVHGSQSLREGEALAANSYYVEGSGVATAFRSLRSQRKRPLRIGVLGLGAGSLSTWFEAGDQIRFYEINPMVVEVANKYFTFLEKAEGDKVVITGDGRIELERELRAGGKTGSHQFDLLIMDAFASDSIPVHLLTEECFEVYDRHLAADGLLVIHITNTFIDLLPVVLHHAKAFDYQARLIEFSDPAKGNDESSPTRWVLLTKSEELLQAEAMVYSKTPIDDSIEPVRWTDQFSSVARQLKWSAKIDLDSLPKKKPSPKTPKSNP